MVRGSIWVEIKLQLATVSLINAHIEFSLHSFQMFSDNLLICFDVCRTVYVFSMTYCIAHVF